MRTAKGSMESMNIKVGSSVEWTSQAGGTTRTKRGLVIEVVPQGTRPKSRSKDPGSPRSHESYAIRASVIDGSELQKKRTWIYWPKVSKLKVC